MEDKVLLDFLKTKRQSKFVIHRPNINLIAQKLSVAVVQNALQSNHTTNNHENKSSRLLQRKPRSKYNVQWDDKTKNKIMTSNEFTLDMCEKFLYCHELLNLKSNKKPIKRWQPKPIQLTPEEKILFDEEELLSAYQNVIANTCGQHRNRQQIKLLQNRLSIEQSDPSQSHLPIHRFCRKGIYPGTSIARQQMHDDQVPWTVELPNYNPPYYTHPSLLNGADDTDPEKIPSNFAWNTYDTNHNVDRRTANPTGHYPIDNNGYPLNSLGRTGLCGRGELKRWAVNYQIHLVIMCGTNEMKSGKEIYKYMMEKRRDDYYCRLPSTWTTGTNMPAITTTLKSFLLNLYQAWNNIHHNDDQKINEIIDHLTFVSTAYVDDSKNTDNAWLETSVCCYIQTNINKTISSNSHIDLNEIFPDPSVYGKTNYAWHYVTRTSKLLDSERDVVRIIAKRYNAYW